MRILFVDDDPQQVDLFKDAVSDWNEKNAPRAFKPTLITNAVEAAAALETTQFDCALFDLKLPKGEGAGERLSGNELAALGLDDVGIPIGILSGYPEDLDAGLAARKLLRTFVKKAGACDEAVAWFGGLWEMMEALGAARRAIRRSGAEIFAKRIWPRWEKYESAKLSDKALETIITRQYAGHISELLGTDGPDNPLWHPLENYIHPALLDHRPHTGDLFLIDGECWVILTPQCDMATQKVQDVLLAHCDPALIEGWDEKVADLAKLKEGEEPSRKLADYFRNYVNQNVDASKHFLPPLDGRPMMVNFKRLATKPLAEMIERLDKDRIASVSPPFLANLTQRFGNYMSRFGQPNIDIRYFT